MYDGLNFKRIRQRWRRNFKRLYNASDVTKRNRNGQTASGLYSLFIPMEWNYEGFIDEHGSPVFDSPDHDVFDPHGELIDVGVSRKLAERS